MSPLSLARRAIGCAGWAWLPGAAFVEADGRRWRVQSLSHAASVHADREPDLDDPATLGCLFALVRAAWGAPCSTVAIPAGGGVARWQVVTYAHGAPAGTRSRVLGEGDTEAAALVAALELAAALVARQSGYSTNGG